ncbi:hypothetical protein HDU93_001419 [Gonapodya sp. JEL0774]|nr:hypothetical protein HDU93_001419 [Gonapodya sp. JEL0774]
MPPTSYPTRIPEDIVPSSSTLIDLANGAVKVPPLGIGVWGDSRTWGYETYDKDLSEKTCKDAFAASLEDFPQTVFFDTAEVYGQGESERILGRCMVDGAKSSAITIATKYMPFPFRGSYPNIMVSSLRASLDRLGVKSVELYQIHGPIHSPLVSLETLADSLAECVKLGLTKTVGVSNYSLEEVTRVHARLATHNIPLASNQIEFSLLRTKPLSSGLVQGCLDLGVAVIAYSPLAMGRLSGKYSAANPPQGGRSFGDVSWDIIDPLVATMKKIGEAHGGKTAAQVALNWIVCKGAIPIPGAKNVAQAHANAASIGWRLTTAEIEELDKVSFVGEGTWFNRMVWQVEDRQVLLRRAALERENRERERKRQAAATKLQSAWRSSCSRAASRDIERAPWDAEFASLSQRWATAPSGDALVGEMEGLVRSFLFFYEQRKDGASLDGLLDWMLNGKRVEGLRPLFVPFASKNERFNSTWKFQLPRLLELCLDRLRARVAVASEKTLQTVEVVMDNKEWDALQEIISPETTAVTTRIYPHLYPALRIAITYDAPHSSRYLSLAIPTLENAMDSAAPHFIAQILSLPQLFDNLALTVLPEFATGSFPCRIVSFLAQTNMRIWMKSSGRNADFDGLCILGNLVAIAKAVLSSPNRPTSELFLSDLVTSVNGLLSLVPVTVLTLDAQKPQSGLVATATRRIDDDEDDDEKAIVSSTVDAMDLDSGVRPDPALVKSLSALCDRAFLTILIRGLASSKSGVQSVANLVTALLTRLPHRKSDVLTAVVFMPGTSPLRGFYDAVIRGPMWLKVGAEIGKAGAKKLRLPPSVFTESNLAADFALLFVLCEVYARMLLTMGDDEFFGDTANVPAEPAKQTAGKSAALRSNPFRLDEVVILASVLRNVAFTLQWNLSSPSLPDNTRISPALEVHQLRAATTRLVQLLHARDSRRAFVPSEGVLDGESRRQPREGFWIMAGEVDVDAFVQAAVVESAEAELEDLDRPSMTNTSSSPPLPMGFGWSQRLNPTGIVNPSPNQSPTSSTFRRDRHSPRVSILRTLPFTVPFETRVLIFRQSIYRDRASQGGDIETAMWGPDGAVVARCTVRRGREFEDGFSGLHALGSRIKKRISITFVNELGMEEAGIDGGGVFKEFLTRLSKQAFDVNYGLFQATREQKLYPNPSTYSRGEDQLRYLEFLGRVVGKAMYEGILVDVQFAEFFLAKWLGRQSYLDDLPSLDPELYNGMIFLKNYQGNVEDLSLSFTVSEQEFGQTRNVDLIKNGSQIPVTNENRIQYIYLVASYKLNTQIAKQSAAFFAGLKDIVNPRWLRMFNQKELQMLLSGSSSPDIDLVDLRRNVVYAGGFDESHPTVANFWKIVERDFTPEEQRLLVRFVTSCSRPPLLGFRELNPKFSIRTGGEDESRLPTASTCVNLLKLPAYKDENALRTKLRYAINSGAGFELS